MLSFILTDLFSSGQSFFGGDQNVGEIGNVEISGIEFNNKVEEAVRTWEAQNQQSANEEIRTSLREQTWNLLLREHLLGSQYKELGVTVSPDELFDMVQGNDPHPQVKQAFTNPETGQFNPGDVIRFLKNLDNDQTGQTKNQWLQFEKGIKEERVATKYNNLILKGLYVTSSMAKQNYIDENEKANISFVGKRFHTIADSTINVTEDDMLTYYNEHKHEFEQDPTRDIDYVRFDVLPTEEDIADAEKWINEIKEEFKSTENDTIFVEFNSDEPIDFTLHAKGSLPLIIDTALFSAELGTVVGPFKDGETYQLAKLVEKKLVPDSVKARHILIKPTQPGDSSVYNKLDSIKTAIKSGADFAEIAKETSEDVGSAVNGGDLGWFTEGQMVPPFNDACFDGVVGDMPIVESQFGFHLIEILDQAEKTEKIRVVKIVKNVEPSNDTYDQIFAQASKFYAENNNGDLFQKAVETTDVVKRTAEVKVSDKTIAGLESPRELIRWAYNNEKGSVSEPLQFGNVFVVAHLAEIKEEGIAPLEQVKIQVEIEAKKEKKAQQFIKEMSGISDLNQLASKVGSTIETAQDVSFSSYSIVGMGNEPEIVGMISTLKQGQTSIPIKGRTGVYVVSINSKTPAPETTDYTLSKQSLEQQFAGKTYQLFDVLKEKFGVVDNRHKFY